MFVVCIVCREMTWSEGFFFAMVGRGSREYYGIEVGGWIRVGWEGGSVNLDERDIRRHSEVIRVACGFCRCD